ncbi:hypothetical protein SGI36_08585 [Providencia rettgeri]|uniref:hypothetical protein n=1 Tax=Providencia TaxID=586 RepID=UPI001B36530A|nr:MULTISPECIES: hypothetical protein [Providencia]MBQ0530470.1 hypothetical protein [Providencia rettgeri]WOB85030.1 hypothetical protein P3L40_15385 [Providencia sp. PROV040]
MNNEILEIAKYLKNKINAGEGIDEYNWQDIIDVCNEIERINNLHPVAFITQEAAKRMNDGIVSNVYVSKDKSPAFNTPIFILK